MTAPLVGGEYEGSAVAWVNWDPSAILGCATCFGASDSEMAQGMNMGIASLLVVVLFVLAAFAVFFVYIARRSAAHPLPVTAVNSPANQHVP